MRFLKDVRKIPTTYKPEFANPNVSVLGGIVAYSPDIERFSECINSIVDQVDQLIIVDNGSENFEDIVKLTDEINAQKCSKKTKVFTKLPKAKAKDTSKVCILKYSENRGIAQALRHIMDFAILQNFDWVLTLDDDSVAMPKLVENYKKFTAMPKVGSMTCIVKDRNFDTGQHDFGREFMYVCKSITSACFISVDAYKKTSGYNPDLFIDRVDDDICYQLTRAGYNHICVNYAGILHEFGKANEKNFLGHTARADNYAPMRQYYIFRNEIIMRKTYPELIRIEWLQCGRPMWINWCLLSLKVLLYEDNKHEKIAAMGKGWRAGKKYIRNKRRGNVVK